MARGFGDIQDNSRRDNLRESDIFEIFLWRRKQTATGYQFVF